MVFMTLGLLFVIFYIVVHFYSRKIEVSHHIQANTAGEVDAMVRRQWFFYNQLHDYFSRIFLMMTLIWKMMM